ncbi:YqgQ family protein [Niallia sp. 01092]|uniref:YqgQ family protein n=1 Tax=unclassified Niallia TaxID=2837522 RepID=UPI003FD2F2B8
MKSIYDVQQYLKSYGTIIYTGDRIGDLELMKSELEEIYQSQLIEKKDLESAIFIINQKIQHLKEEREK